MKTRIPLFLIAVSVFVVLSIMAGFLLTRTRAQAAVILMDGYELATGQTTTDPICECNPEPNPQDIYGADLTDRQVLAIKFLYYYRITAGCSTDQALFCPHDRASFVQWVVFTGRLISVVGIYWGNTYGW